MKFKQVKKNKRKIISVLTAMTMFLVGISILLFQGGTVSASNVRETVSWPNSAYYNINPRNVGGGLFYLPSSATIENDIIANNDHSEDYLQFTRRTADQSIVNSIPTIDLYNKDFVLQLDMNFGTAETYGAPNFRKAILNRGMGIVLHPNNINQMTGAGNDGDYSRLGMYGHVNGNDHIKNALAVEFDMLQGKSDADNQGDYYDGAGSVPESHIAITRPISPTNKSELVHHATSAYQNLNNGAYHRVVVSWRMTGTDQYTFSYAVYATDNPAEGEQPAAQGAVVYTRAQAEEIFGGAQQVRLSITGSNGYRYFNADHASMYVRFPETYDYTVNYFIREPDGTLTTTPVPGLVTDYSGGDAGGTPSTYTQGGTANPVYGKSPAGAIHFNLPEAPLGYVLVADQETTRYVSSDASQNIYTFYYEPIKRPYTVKYYREDTSQPLGNDNYVLVESFGFNDYTGTTVTAMTREEALAQALLAGIITPERASLYQNGFIYVEPDDPGPIKSNPTGVVAPDGSLELKMYYKARADLPYTVKYQLESTSVEIAEPSNYNDGMPMSVVDLNDVAGAVKAIPGYTLLTTDLSLPINSIESNVKILEYAANTDTPYTVEYYRVPIGKDPILFKKIHPTGTTGTTVHAVIESYYGYAQNNAYPGSLLNAVLVADDPSTPEIESPILKVYYSPVNVAYLVEHYVTGEATPFHRLSLLGATDSMVTASEVEKPGYYLDTDNSSNSESITPPNPIDANPMEMTLENWQATGGLTLTMRYLPRTDLAVTVRHLKSDGSEYKPDTVLNNQVMDNTITVYPESHPGYDVDENSKTYQVKATDNVVIFTYTPRTDTEYKIEYYSVETNQFGTEVVELLGTWTQEGTTDNIVTAGDVRLDTSPDTQAIRDKLTASHEYLPGYHLNILSGVVDPVNTTVLKVYYPLSMEKYTIEYYLADANGIYPTLPTSIVESSAVLNSTVYLNDVKKDPAGYTYQVEAETVDTIVVTADDTDILKAFYTPNNDTSYKMWYYIQNPANPTEYLLCTNPSAPSTGSGITDTNVPLTTSCTMPGYGFARAEANFDIIKGDGSTEVKFYFDLVDNAITLNYYVQGRFWQYPQTPSVTTTVSAKLGESVTPPVLTDLATYDPGNDNAALYKEYHGFHLDPNYHTADSFPVMISTADQVINIYYSTMQGGHYQVEHYINDIVARVPILKDTVDYADAVSSATISLDNKVFDSDVAKGYIYDGSKTDSVLNYNIANLYTTAGVSPILYPNLPHDAINSFVIRLYYNPVMVDYEVRHYIPDGTGDYKVALIVPKQGLASGIATADPAEDDPHLSGYTYEPGNINNVKSLRIEGDGTTVLKLYYAADTTTTYQINYYLASPEGAYSVLPSSVEYRTGTTGATVYATVDGTMGGAVRDFLGYSFDVSNPNNRLSGDVSSPDQLELNVYYTANTNASYKIEYYFLKKPGFVKDETIKATDTILNQVVGKNVYAEIPTIPGYAYVSTMSTPDGVVAGDNSLVLKLYYNVRTDTPYTIQYYLNSDTATIEQSEFGMTGMLMTVSPRMFPGYSFNPDDSRNVLSAPIDGSGGTKFKLYYTAKDAEYVVKHLTEVDGSASYRELAESVSGIGKVGDIITNMEPLTIPGYTTPASQNFSLDAEYNEFFYLYELDTAQNNFQYTVNYYLTGTTDPVPGIDQNPSTGNATPSGTGYAGEVIVITHPSLMGYRVEGGSPTELIVKTDGTAVATVYYCVNPEESFAYTINYFLNGTTNPVPGIVPSTVTGMGVIGQDVQINPPAVSTGYKVAGSYPNKITITSDADANAATIYYVVDTAQTFQYTVHYVTTAGTVLQQPQSGYRPVESVVDLTASPITGYKPVAENPTQLTISSGENVAYLKYEVNTAENRTTGFVIVTYYDGEDSNTANQIGSIWLQGDVGTSYSVTQPNIDGYDYKGLAQPSDALTGTFAAETQYVNLYYEAITRPSTPVIDALITDETTVVTGKADPKTTVTLSVLGSPIGTGVADEGTGKFEIAIAMQTEGTVITAISTDTAGLNSEPDNVAVVKLNAPSITAPDVEISEGTAFNNLKKNVTAVDSDGNDITSDIEVTGTVDVNTPGTYLLQYHVTDGKGITGYAVRKVTVTALPNAAPVLTVPAAPISLTVGDSFDASALIADNTVKATDAEDGTITPTVEKDTVDTSKPGVYLVLYKATDSDGATSYKTLEVQVSGPSPEMKDLYRPIAKPEVITVNGTPDYSDNITNLAELPVASPAIVVIDDSNVKPNLPGVYEATVAVKYSDNSQDIVVIPVFVKEVITDADRFAPIVVPEEIVQNGVVDLSNNVVNLTDLPAETYVTDDTDMSTIPTDTPGTYEGALTIHYPDSSTKTVNVPIIVKPADVVAGSGKLIVRASDPNGVVLAEVELVGLENSSYNVAIPTIKGYQYQGLDIGSAPLSGVFNNGTQTIRMKFSPKAKPKTPVLNGPFTDKTDLITGKGSPGDVITIKDGAGNPLGSKVADGNGDFSIHIPCQLPGTVLVGIATTPDGNSEYALAAVMPSAAAGSPPSFGEVKTVTLKVGDRFAPARYSPSAIDAEDGTLDNKVVVEQNNVDTGTPGKYSVIYRVTDSDGHTAYKIMTVIVSGSKTSLAPLSPDMISGTTDADTPPAEDQLSNEQKDTQDTPAGSIAHTSQEEGWSVVNFILAILITLISFVMLMNYLRSNRGKKRKNIEDIMGRLKASSILSVLAAVSAILLFMFAEDMNQPAVVINRWTILMSVIAALQIVLAAFPKMKELRG